MEQLRRYLLAKANVYKNPGDETKAAYDLAFALLVGQHKPACFRGNNHVLTQMETGFERLLTVLAECGCPNPDSLTVFKFYTWLDHLEEKYEAQKPTPTPHAPKRQ
ncbi:hypothetical protein GCM10028818_40980 [Spirosoma horti]